MTTVDTDVSAYEHGRLRLFSVDADTEGGKALIEALKTDDREAGALSDALGTRADPYWVDLVAVRDIAELGLPGYLGQAYDIPKEKLAAADLSAAGSHVLIVPSRSFNDEAATLSPAQYLEPLAQFDAETQPGSITPLESAPAQRQARADPPPETPPAGRRKRRLPGGAILVLLLVAAAFVAVVAL